MRAKDSATSAGPVAFGPGRAFRVVVGWLVQGWHDAVYLHTRLIDLQRPWEQEGALRWRRQIGGTRLIGSRLPVGDPQ